jgi:hypothetical protein
VPADITRLVTTLLAKAPQDRPPTAVHVVAEIDRLLTPRATKPRSSLRTAIAIASGLAFSLSAIGAWYRWLRTPARAAAVTQAPTIERLPLAEGSRLAVDTSAPTLIQLDAGVPDAPLPDAPLPDASLPRRIAKPLVIDARIDEVTPEIGGTPAGGVDSVVTDVDPQ